MNTKTKAIIRELGAGLILRRSSPDDADALSEFCGLIHSEEPGTSDPQIVSWVRDLLTRPHPTFHPDDFTIVEETATGRIVSTLNLISQTWSYEGIPFGVGRPELVGTLPEFRNRGLVRLQMEEVHRWSAQRGELVQAITGIPFYYRLFDYEMALQLDAVRSGFAVHVPELAPGQEEPCTFRAATPADLPFITRVYREGHTRCPIACVRDEATWDYDLRGRSKIVAQPLIIIESRLGQPLGVIRYAADVSKRRGLTITMYELDRGVSWLEITPAVMRYAWQLGQQIGAEQGRTCSVFTFYLGESHPVYDAFRTRLPDARPAYAWYVRVSDMPKFLMHIAPALEKRLAASYACGYTGTLSISFYRSGLGLVFDKGRLTAVRPWRPAAHNLEGQVAFPGLTFIQLLFGYRSFDELQFAFADCVWSSPEARALVDALFPKKPSQVVGLS